jgi:hypothetical protein
MIQLKPYKLISHLCECGVQLNFEEILWQGLHVCLKLKCDRCRKIIIRSLPVNQSGIQRYDFYPADGVVKDDKGNIIPGNWYSRGLKSVAHPVDGSVDLKIEIFRHYENVIILNTLDIIFGHSLLFLLNLQRIIENEKNLGIIVIVQPMLRWLVPEKDVAEIWTVNLEFSKLNHFFPDLSDKINRELERFNNVFLSKGHVLPTNKNIRIELFSGILPFDFNHEPAKPRITFIWREDPDRLWIRNIYLLKGFKKLKISFLIFPIHHLRVMVFFFLLRRKMGNSYLYTVAGQGKTGRLPSFINDRRVRSFNPENDKLLCRVYSESELVIGVHGSGMLLPSAHAGMAISLMPSRRWGNFAEDILFTESDKRLSAFQRRVVPLNLNLLDVRDILIDMITGREYFIKKFIHDEEL